MGKPKYVEYANRVLATLGTIPEEYWERVLYLVNDYAEYRKHLRKDRTRRSRSLPKSL